MVSFHVPHNRTYGICHCQVNLMISNYSHYPLSWSNAYAALCFNLWPLLNVLSMSFVHITQTVVIIVKSKFLTCWSVEVPTTSSTASWIVWLHASSSWEDCSGCWSWSGDITLLICNNSLEHIFILKWEMLVSLSWQGRGESRIEFTCKLGGNI